ncbi:hypothetical protein SAMN04244547_03042 [Azotobacter vinelandii]|nr:hypothetical protein SAMN04244547_03042 [Azotobacter vinelandii]
MYIGGYPITGHLQQSVVQLLHLRRSCFVQTQIGRCETAMPESFLQEFFLVLGKSLTVRVELKIQCLRDPLQLNGRLFHEKVIVDNDPRTILRSRQACQHVFQP